MLDIEEIGQVVCYLYNLTVMFVQVPQKHTMKSHFLRNLDSMKVQCDF